MCMDNSVDRVCGHPLSSYIEREHGKGKPVVFFCNQTRGIILQTLLDLLESAASLSGNADSPPDVAAQLVNSREYFWPLVKECNLNFAKNDTTGAWNHLVLHAFRNQVKWVQRRAVEFHAIIRMPAGWQRGRTFENAKEAGEWLAGMKQQISSVPSTPIKAKDMATSIWATPSPAPSPSPSRFSGIRQDQLNTAMEQLNLSLELSDRQRESIAVSGQTPPFVSAPLRPEEIEPPARLNILGKPMGSPVIPPLEQTEAAAPPSIAEWSAAVRNERQGGMSRDEILNRLDRLGRERVDIFQRLVKIEQEVHDLTALM